MDEYLTEEERLEALKRWWKENGRAVVMGALFGIALILGWNFWQTSQRQKAVQASSLYQQLLGAVDKQQTEPAVKLAERLVEQYPSTTYALYGKFFLAKFKVQAGDLAGAKQILEAILEDTGDDDYRHVARLRLGQILLALGETEAALKLIEPLNAETMGRYAGLYEELKGDLYGALNRPDDARLAYQRARELGQVTPLLELKLQDLGTAGS